MSGIQQGQPMDEKSKWQEGSKYNLSPSGHCLFIVKSGITALDVAAVSEGAVRLALYENGPVLFLLYKLGENEWEEVPFSWHTQRDMERIYLDEKVDGSFEYSFRVILAELSGSAAAVREITLDAGFAAKLHDIILRQSRSMFNAQSFLKHLNSVYNSTDVSDMVNLAEVHFKST